MKPSLKARGTLKDVANAVGVSHTTVSNAFNRPDQLSPKLRETIVATARSMNYSGPNPAARMLRTGFARTIAVVWTDPMPHAFEDQAASSFLAGVAEACVGRGFALLLVQGGESSSRSVQTAAIDGLIIYSMPDKDSTLQIVADRALPTVVVDQPIIPNIPFVGIDNRAASRACAQHLKTLGHKRFAIVSLRLGTDGYRGFVTAGRLKNASFELSRRRIEGYLDIIGRNGSNFSAKIWECPCSIEEEGRIAGENLLKLSPPPTAILAASDRLAIGVIEAARKSQLRVPEDLSVVGFDDIPAAKLITPELTTANQPLREKGRLAVSSLLDGKEPLRCVLPTKLVIRNSTAVCPGSSRKRVEFFEPSG
ncbi:MAG TPA: LacI family DNA-binding transcriptional regulator [Terrimicrobiaceae bacterium]